MERGRGDGAFEGGMVRGGFSLPWIVAIKHTVAGGITQEASTFLSASCFCLDILLEIISRLNVDLSARALAPLSVCIYGNHNAILDHSVKMLTLSHVSSGREQLWRLLSIPQPKISSSRQGQQ